MAALSDPTVFASACLAVLMAVGSLGMASHLREQIAAARGQSLGREG